VRVWSIISWQRVRRQRAASSHRLDVNWEEFTDGRIRRLRRGQEYEAEIAEVEEAAGAAAARLGMVARTTFESIPRMRYFDSDVWVQFADHEIDAGQPCPCGEPYPITIHPTFARCPSCGSRLAVKAPKGSKRGRPQSRGDRNGWAGDESGPEEGERMIGTGSKSREPGVVKRVFRRRRRARSKRLPAQSADTTSVKSPGTRVKGGGAKAKRAGAKTKRAPGGRKSRDKKRGE
jgi:hypothetical protein